MALRGRRIDDFKLNYGVYWLHEVWKFEFHPPVFKKVTSDHLIIEIS